MICLTNLSQREQLKQLTALEGSVWFKALEYFSRSKKQSILSATLNAIPNSVETFFVREQAVGEMAGLDWIFQVVKEEKKKLIDAIEAEQQGETKITPQESI